MAARLGEQRLDRKARERCNALRRWPPPNRPNAASMTGADTFVPADDPRRQNAIQRSHEALYASTPFAMLKPAHPPTGLPLLPYALHRDARKRSSPIMTKDDARIHRYYSRNDRYDRSIDGLHGLGKDVCQKGVRQCEEAGWRTPATRAGRQYAGRQRHPDHGLQAASQSERSARQPDRDDCNQTGSGDRALVIPESTWRAWRTTGPDRRAC